MRKSEKNIEKDLYKLVVASPLATMIAGKVYRKGMRPENSVQEDIVVKFLAGRESQIQKGQLLLNVYVSDKTQMGTTRLVENTSRVEQLEDAIIAFLDSHPSSEYLYELEDSPNSLEVEGISQHVITARINYQRITE